MLPLAERLTCSVHSVFCASHTSCTCAVAVQMDVPGPSRCRCREPAPSSGRNVRPRYPMADLVQSWRRRHEEAAAATLAARAATPRLRGEAPVPTLPAHVPAAADRNVRPRLSPSQKTSSSPAAAVSSSDYSRPYTVLSELTSNCCRFSYLGCLLHLIQVPVILRRSFLSTCVCNHRSAE